MIKKLSRHGNSLALVLDRPVLELLKIDEDTPLEVSTDGKVLTVSPVRDAARRRKFEQAVAKTHRRFGKVFKRVARR